MRIAVPLINDQLATVFDQTHLFALYDLDNQSRAAQPLGRISLADFAHDVPAALARLRVEAVLAAEIAPKTINALLAYGILAITQTPVAPPEDLLAQLAAGTLRAAHPTAVPLPET